jgi:nicotinamidase-related amidase
MPLTTLDPKTALVVIDLQKGIVAFAAAQRATELVNDVVAKSAALANAFRHRGLPVVLVNVDPGPQPRSERPPPRGGEFPPDWKDIVPEMNPQPTDHRVTKHSWGAFTHTDLEAWLRSQGVTQIVLCGISTSIGVESTARSAYEHGLNIAFAIDALADMSDEAHQNSITRIFPRLGETGTTQEIINLVKKSA